MGVTIHHRLSIQKVNVKRTLDRTQSVAESLKCEQAEKLGIYFEVRRLSDYQLFIDIGNCETLAFDFKSVKQLVEDEPHRYSYARETLTNGGQIKLDEGYNITEYPQNEIYYASDFCKTQFAKSIIEHKWVADLIRSVASYCLTAEVNDEGDYYHSGQLEQATEAIEENGKLINSIGSMLTGQGWENTQIIKGGETVIRSRKNKNK